MKVKHLDRALRRRQEELFALEGSLLSASKGGRVQSIYVSSSRPREGKTTSAVLMAASLATTSKGPVLLVDGSVASPTLHRLFDLPQSPGLTDFIAGKASADEAVYDTDRKRLRIMPRGELDPELSDTFDSETFAKRISGLKNQYDYVIVDGDSTLTSSEACLAAKNFDGVVLVAACERTKWEVLDVARQKIDNVGGNLLGVILNQRRYYVPKILYGRI